MSMLWKKEEGREEARPQVLHAYIRRGGGDECACMRVHELGGTGLQVQKRGHTIMPPGRRPSPQVDNNPTPTSGSGKTPTPGAQIFSACLACPGQAECRRCSWGHSTHLSRSQHHFPDLMMSFDLIQLTDHRPHQQPCAGLWVHRMPGRSGAPG